MLKDGPLFLRLLKLEVILYCPGSMKFFLAKLVFVPYPKEVLLRDFELGMS